MPTAMLHKSLVRTLLMAATVLGASAAPCFIWPTVVGQGSVRLLERFGKYKCTLEPGLHWTIPFVDRAHKVTTKELVVDTPPQNCITKDNAPLKADAVLYYRIFDPKRALYGVENLRFAISNLAQAQVRAEIGKLSLDETFAAREALSKTLLQVLDGATGPWGVSVTRVEIKEIAPYPDILESMELVMSAERQKRAAILRSEGERESARNAAAAAADAAVQAAEADKTSVVLKAEADAAAVRLAAEAAADSERARSAAQRDALMLTKEALDGSAEAASRIEMLRQYTEATALLTASPNAKTVVLPRGDEWLAKIGVAMSDAPGPEP